MNNWGPAIIVLLGIAAGVLYPNARFTDLRDAMNKRFNDANDFTNKWFDDLRDLLKSEVKRLEDRISHTRV